MHVSTILDFLVPTQYRDKYDDKHSYLLPPHTILIYITNASNY